MPGSGQSKGAFVWDQSGIRIVEVVQESFRLGAIFIPEYLDSTQAPKRKKKQEYILRIYSFFSGLIPNESALSVVNDACFFTYESLDKILKCDRHLNEKKCI